MTEELGTLPHYTEEEIPLKIEGLRSPSQLVAEGLSRMSGGVFRKLRRLSKPLAGPVARSFFSSLIRGLIVFAGSFFGWNRGISLLLLNPTGPISPMIAACCVLCLASVVVSVRISWQFAGA